MLNYPVKSFLILLLASTCLAQRGTIEVDQSVVPFVKITNADTIKYLLENMMIPETDVKRLHIYDLNQDGFGEGDLARTFPGGKVYQTTPDAQIQKMMNRWSFGNNVRFTAYVDDRPGQFENAPDSARAMGGIFASLLRGIRRNYKGKPIKIHLTQDEDITSILLWGYIPELMQYTPPPLNRIPEEVPVMKLIYLEKTTVDSVFTGTPAAVKRRR